MRKKAGRPEISPSQRRGKIFRFVVTDAEARNIRRRAKDAGLTISEYLRSVALPEK